MHLLMELELVLLQVEVIVRGPILVTPEQTLANNLASMLSHNFVSVHLSVFRLQIFI